MVANNSQTLMEIIWHRLVATLTVHNYVHENQNHHKHENHKHKHTSESNVNSQAATWPSNSSVMCCVARFSLAKLPQQPDPLRAVARGQVQTGY